MTDEEIKRWAFDAGFEFLSALSVARLRRFAELVAEECAKVAEDQAVGGSAFNNAATHIAAAIRAKHQQDGGKA